MRLVHANAAMKNRVQALEAEKTALRQQVGQLQREKQQLEQRQEEQAVALRDLPSAAGEAGGSVELGQGSLPAELEARIVLLQQELTREQAERRKIHNELVDLRGNVRGSIWAAYLACQQPPSMLSPSLLTGPLLKLSPSNNAATNKSAHDAHRSGCTAESGRHRRTSIRSPCGRT